MSAGATLDDDLRSAYLGRLGLEAEPPSVEALQRLHRRHVERVPYETMWIHAGEVWDIDPVQSAARIAFGGRGGYCYHLNGAFSELLRSLGYVVTRHLGGVHGPSGPEEAALGNHLVVTVAELPSAASASGSWYADAGLGDALYGATPLVAGEVEQPPFVMTLEATTGPTGDWHLTHDPSGAFPGMSWRSAPAEMADFAAHHQRLSTSPDSGFVRVATAQRRDATGADILRGLVLTRVGEGTAPSQPLTTRGDWFAVLADVFGLRLERSTGDQLWARVLAAHRAWEASGGQER